MTLRQLYRLDGWVMLIVGVAFFDRGPAFSYLFGIPLPDQATQYAEWWMTLRGLAFSRVMGAALMAFGFATLAVARADGRVQRSSMPLFLAAHGFLLLITWGQAQAVWVTLAGVVLVNLFALPGLGFLYFMIAPGAIPGRATQGRTDRETQIREVAGQEERTRLAQDLHDSVKQQIYSVQANLAAVEARWAGDDTDGAREALAHARSSAQSAMAEMIALLDRLRTDPIESVGLVEALRRQSDALRFQTGARVTTTFGDMPAPARFAPGAATAVFRIAQEALANIARHARPSHVTLDAGIEQGSDTFVLKVADDGRGFDRSRPSSGTGLANMHARASEAGASLGIESGEGRGCAIALRVPLTDPVGERVVFHVRRAIASALPLALLAWTASMATAAGPYVWVLLVAAAAFVVGHGTMALLAHFGVRGRRQAALRTPDRGAA